MDSAKRARIRSGEAATKRIADAASEIVGAITSESLDDDDFSRKVAAARYENAEEKLQGALDLIRDARRSIEGRSE